MDGALVGVDVLSALAEWDYVVDVGGSGLAADVAGAAVLAEDALVVALLLPA